MWQKRTHSLQKFGEANLGNSAQDVARYKFGGNHARAHSTVCSSCKRAVLGHRFCGSVRSWVTAARLAYTYIYICIHIYIYTYYIHAYT